MPEGWSHYAAESNGHDFTWGQWDCMLDIADWLKVSSGLEASANYRGRYDDAESCRALFRKQGGIVKALRHDAAAMGLEETLEPRPGDIGLVKAFGVLVKRKRAALFAMGGILMPSGRWRVRGLEGHIAHAFPVIVAWELPCRR
jgi:hypothetical protein